MSAIVTAMDMVFDCMRKDKQVLCSAKQSEKAITAAAYVIFALCAAVVLLKFTDHDFSLVLTMSTSLQCLGFFLLYQKAKTQKSVEGLSSRTLEMYVLVLCFRLSSTLVKNGYLPVDRSGDWVYQLADIGSLVIVLALLVLIHKKYKGTYDAGNDTMPIFNFIPACVLMAICVHGDLNDSPFFDVMWTIGLNLDTIAMLPQLWLLTKLGGNVDALTSHFVALQVLSRCCSFAFWFYGYVEITPEHQFNAAGYMIIVAHLAQLLLSADFMYYYVKSVVKRSKMTLPVMEV
jgi:uncharacterized protein with PQ loop repeat